MKKLTKKDLENLVDFSGATPNQQLNNGEIGYCEEENLLVVCCRNCGDYTWINLAEVIATVG